MNVGMVANFVGESSKLSGGRKGSVEEQISDLEETGLFG